MQEENAQHPIHQVTLPKTVPSFKLVQRGQQEWWQVPDAPGRYGGTLYQASIGNGPKTLNYWAAFDATSSGMAGHLLAGLVDSDPYTGGVRPWLAKSVTVAPDNKTYRVVLRKGLSWSDGKPLTSEDVLFTWNTILKRGLGNPSMRGIVTVAGQFPEVTAKDAYTIEFKTAEPFAPFIRSLGTPIAPAHIFKPIVEQGGDKAFSAAWSTQQASEHPERFVSAGQWLLERYEPGQRLVFKRNANSGLQDSEGQGLPYLERLIYRFVKDVNNVQLQFEQGGLDVYEVAPNYVGRTKALKKPAFSLYNLGPAPSSTFFVFNLNSRVNPQTHKASVAPVVAQWFANRHFRQAIDWALDRNLMVETTLKGVGSPLFTAESPKALFVHPKLAKGHPKNLACAKKLLRQEGFYFDKADGFLRDRHGNKVSFTLLTNAGNDLREGAGLAIQQDLKALGIDVQFKPVEFNALISRMQTGEWETMIMGLSGGDLLEPHFSANVWKSDGALHLFNQRTPGQPVTDKLPWEAELDTLFEQGARTLETKARQPYYWRYQEIISEEAPMLYLYSAQSIVAVKERVANLNLTPIASPLHNIYALWIKDGKGKVE